MVPVKNNRVSWLDTVRVLASLMVIIMNAPIPNKELISRNLFGAISYQTYPCIGMFFYGIGCVVISCAAAN